MKLKQAIADLVGKIFNLSSSYAMWQWKKRCYSAPSPHRVKMAVLLRNSFPNGIWIETGTYLGDTTKILLGHGSFVYSIEPEPTLFANAHAFFKNYHNVRIINGLSEEIFPSLLPSLTGTVNFWLDGHFSEGVTHRGPQDTPILDELRIIAANMNKFEKVCVMIDDVRCFNTMLEEYSTYPSLKRLVGWAEELGLLWHIEHDIFIAKSVLNPVNISVV